MEDTEIIDNSLPSLPEAPVEETAQVEPVKTAATYDEVLAAAREKARQELEPSNRAVIETISQPVPDKVEPAAPAPQVVVAPVCHGRSFILRQSYDPSGRLGQMLVLLDKQQRHAPMEVVHAFLPTDRSRPVGRKTDRYYMGDRRISKRHLALIMEIQIQNSNPPSMNYRLLYPSGKPFREWTPLNLATLRIKTEEEHRVMISAFTGILYKLQEGVTREERRKQYSQQALGNAFQQAGVNPEELKRNFLMIRRPPRSTRWMRPGTVN